MKLKNRISSFLFYWGVPVFPSQRFLNEHENTSTGSHYRKAATVLFVFNTCMFLAICIWTVVIELHAKYSPFSLETLLLFNRFYVVYISAAILLLGIAVWLFYFLGFLLKKEVNFKSFSRLKENQKFLLLSFYMQLTGILFLLFIVFTSIHSYQLSKYTIKPAKVTMLYDDMGCVPKWVLTLGFYQVELAARQKYGPGSVSVERINHDNLKEALSNSSFLFLSVHGNFSSGKYAGDFVYFNNTRDKMYICGPDQIRQLGIGKNLKYIYLAQCNGGSKAKEWEEVFYPAEVKSYNRISTYPSHIYWLWIKLPKILLKDI